MLRLLLLVNTKAAAALLAVYSRLSPGLPCAVSTPSAIPPEIMPEPTKPVITCIASVPALQANSKSAARVL